MIETLNNILKNIDSLFADGKITEAENYMLEKMNKARDDDDLEIEIAMCNEIAGYYRVSGNEKACFDALNRALSLQEQNGYAKDISYATTLLNKATACVAYGYVDEALSIYEGVKDYYSSNLKEVDFRVASLYNNMSSALLTIGRIDEGLDYLELSMAILNKLSNSEIERATCHTNIALLKMAKGDMEAAEQNLNCAINIFENQSDLDVHYDATMAALGNLRFKQGSYEEAAIYYEDAAKRTKEKFGRNYNYIVLCKNCEQAWNKAGNGEKALYYNDEVRKGSKDGRKQFKKICKKGYTGYVNCCRC